MTSQADTHTVSFHLSTAKLLFPLARDIGISYILLHDSMLKDDSFRSETPDSSTCECAMGKRDYRVQTTERYLFYCIMEQL